MESSLSETCSLREAYKFAQESGLSSEAAEIRDMEIEWDRNYTSTVRRGRIIELFESRGVLSRFIDQFWPFGKTPKGQTLKHRYVRIWDEYKRFQKGEFTAHADIEEQNALEFAMEAHLRDFLAKNLDRIETGLRLYEKDGQSGIEYVIDDGRIDLLAVDRNGKYVVIELKLSRGRNRTLGQCFIIWVG